MKKNYIAPSVNVYEIALASMLAASPNSISSEEAAQGSKGNPVNFGRGGIFDDSEE
ncbi:MAG: hypothetical protein IJ200_06430 [Prevotella sp.]|nr:hypothetical protein [Prevotella sp.]